MSNRRLKVPQSCCTRECERKAQHHDSKGRIQLHMPLAGKSGCAWGSRRAHPQRLYRCFTYTSQNRFMAHRYASAAVLLRTPAKSLHKHFTDMHSDSLWDITLRLVQSSCTLVETSQRPPRAQQPRGDFRETKNAVPLTKSGKPLRRKPNAQRPIVSPGCGDSTPAARRGGGSATGASPGFCICKVRLLPHVQNRFSGHHRAEGTPRAQTGRPPAACRTGARPGRGGSGTAHKCAVCDRT